jgi:hypothetical protein
MQFRTNDVIGIFVFDFSDTTGWSEKVKDYYNKGDIIDVDFDVVIETHFTVDFLNNKFVAVDQEAQDWAKSLVEFMQPKEEVEKQELAFA